MGGGWVWKGEGGVHEGAGGLLGARVVSRMHGVGQWHVCIVIKLSLM
jgi:hypothetical protein